MGSGMALNFHKAGHLYRVWNRTRAKAQAIAYETGVPLAASPEDLAGQCDLILTCVSRDADVIEMIERITPAVSAGKLVVDTSTTSSHTARQAAALLLERGVQFLDAPVSGGAEGARNGTLAMMVGGS